jgi:hypothetical protein
MAQDRTHRQAVGDSVWCGGAACLLLAFMDVVAFMKGGREDVPASVLWVAVAGLLLLVLNVYFVIRDVVGGRRKAAALGVMLSLFALLAAFDPPWRHYVRRSLNGLKPTGCAAPNNGFKLTSAAWQVGAALVAQCSADLMRGLATNDRLS